MRGTRYENRTEGGFKDFSGAAVALWEAAAALWEAAADLNSLVNLPQTRPSSIRVMSTLKLSSYLAPRTSKRTYLGILGAGGEGRAGTFSIYGASLRIKLE